MYIVTQLKSMLLLINYANLIECPLRNIALFKELGSTRESGARYLVINTKIFLMFM